MDRDLVFHFAFFYFIFLYIAGSIPSIKLILSNRDHALLKPPERNGDKVISQFLFFKLALAVTFISYYFVGKPNLQDYGFANIGHKWPLAFCAGVGIYFVFIWLFQRLTNALGITEILAAEGYIGMRTLWPKKSQNKSKLFAVLVLNPITEELLFRGVLVYFLGTITGMPILFIFIGLLVCLAVHAYQGLRILLFHAFFYCVAVSLMYSPLGIVAAFGMHLAGDLYPLTLVRRQLEIYRSVRRELRPLNTTPQ